MSQPLYPQLDRIQKVAVYFSVTCINKRAWNIGANKAGIVFEVRDSLIHRAWAVKWHLNVLRKQRQSIEARFLHNVNSGVDCHQLLLDSHQLQSYLFDDVIFNVASMFDYIGNLVGIAYRGLNKSRTKWNGAFKGAHDQKNDISQSPVSMMLKAIHADWVDHIMGFRGDNVHHKVELGDAEYSVGCREQSPKTAINIYMPTSLRKRLFRACTGDLDIIEGAERIAETSAKHCNDILTKMTETLTPRYRL